MLNSLAPQDTHGLEGTVEDVKKTAEEFYKIEGGGPVRPEGGGGFIRRAFTNILRGRAFFKG